MKKLKVILLKKIFYKDFNNLFGSRPKQTQKLLAHVSLQVTKK